MTEIKTGQLVRSLAGRDKGKHYLVLQTIDHRYALVVDGRTRTLDRPKKKNIVHLQHYERWADFKELIDREQLTDSQIIKFLKDLAPAAGVPG